MDDLIGPQLNKGEWKEILTDENLIKELDIKILQEFAKSYDHSNSSHYIAPLVGLKSLGSISLNMYQLAVRISKKYEVSFYEHIDKRRKGRKSYWRLFFTGFYHSQRFYWKVRDELIEALIELELIESDSTNENYMLDEEELYYEGSKVLTETIAYKRNRNAREKCIEYYGCSCYACGFDFKNIYGEWGEGFIHVHHKKRKAYSGKEHKVDPINDLIPLCPNCHSMVHKEKNMLEIEELLKIIEECKS